MMRTVFRIFSAITGILGFAAYAGYRATIYSHDTHEGGDAFGPIGLFGFIAMFVFSALSIITGMITLGIWIGERNHGKSREQTLELD
jgi:uncharacterized membrane protein